MGTDIGGWVEVKAWDGKWIGILQIWPLVSRNYAVFSSLFGIRDRVGFRPIAPERGLPADISREAREDFEKIPSQEYVFGGSWITWSEINAINWEEEPETKKYLLIKYQKNQDGEITVGFGEHYESPAQIAQQLGLDADTDEGEYGWKEGEKWEKDSQTYEVRKLTRKNVLDKGWKLLFQVMEHVALGSANKDSRLVVWFD